MRKRMELNFYLFRDNNVIAGCTRSWCKKCLSRFFVSLTYNFSYDCWFIMVGKDIGFVINNFGYLFAYFKKMLYLCAYNWIRKIDIRNTSLTLFRFLRNKIYLYFLRYTDPHGVAAAKGEYVSHDRWHIGICISAKRHHKLYRLDYLIFCHKFLILLRQRVCKYYVKEQWLL